MKFKKLIPDGCVIVDKSDPDFGYEWTINNVEVVGLSLSAINPQLNMPDYDAMLHTYEAIQPGSKPYFFVEYSYVEYEDKHVFVNHAMVTDGEAYSSVYDLSDDDDEAHRLMVEKRCFPVPPKEMLLEALGGAGG